MRIDPRRRRRGGGGGGVPFHTDDPAELAEAPGAHLIVVSVKVPAHAAIVRAAIAAGKAVLCEWPLAIDASEAADLATLAEARGVPLFVGLQARMVAEIRQIKALIADGAIGEVQSSSVLAAVGTPWNGLTDSRRTYLNDSVNGATMRSIPLGHMIDCLEFVLGDLTALSAMETIRRRCVRVTDRDVWIDTDVADQIVVAGRLASGAAVSLHYRGTESRAGNFRWEISGTEGDLLITGASGHVQFGGLTVLGASDGEPAMHPIAMPEMDKPATVAAVAGTYRAIHDALSGRESMAITADHAVRLHSLIEAMVAE